MKLFDVMRIIRVGKIELVRRRNRNGFHVASRGIMGEFLFSIIIAGTTLVVALLGLTALMWFSMKFIVGDVKSTKEDR